MSEQDIKNLMNFTRGSVATRDVKEWARKCETKLMAKEVGVETSKNKKTTSSTASTASVHHMMADEHAEYNDENEVLEACLRSSMATMKVSNKKKTLEQRVIHWKNMKFEKL